MDYNITIDEALGLAEDILRVLADAEGYFTEFTPIRQMAEELKSEIEDLQSV